MHRILVIDDDELLLASVKRWFRRELRCDVHCAREREEAEALLDCYQYSLVMIDLSLSPHRLEGIDLIERVANAPSPSKLIVLTGNDSEQVRSEAMRKGVDRYLQKPTPIQEIIAIARQLMELDGLPGRKRPSGRRRKERCWKACSIPRRSGPMSSRSSAWRKEITP